MYCRRIAVGAVARRRLRVGPHEPEEQVGSLRAVLAVDDVADAADGLYVEHRRRSQVGDHPDGMLGNERVRRAANESAQDSAPDAYAARPDLQHLHRVLGVNRSPVVDDVDDPRANDAADDGPDRDGEDGVGVYLPQRGPAGDQHHGSGHRDKAEQAMPAEGQRRNEVCREQEGADVDFYHGYLAAQILRSPSLGVKELLEVARTLTQVPVSLSGGHGYDCCG